MKIVVLGCKDYPPFKYGRDVGGLEVFLYNILPILKNHEFMIVTRRYGNAKKYENIEGVDVYRVNFVNLALFKTISFNFLAFFLLLNKKYDLIWAHEPVAGFFAFFLSVIKRKPYLLHIHSNGSYEPGPFSRKIGLKILETIAFIHPKKVIYVSEKLKQRFKIPGIIVPIGINNKESVKHPVFDKLKNKKILVYIGRLTKVKNVDKLILALKFLDNNYVLLIVGEGSEKTHLISFTKRLKLSLRVIFLGFQPSSNIIPYCHAVILASSSEGLPHVVLESLKYNKPIFATRVGDIPKLIPDYLILDNINPRYIAEKISKTKIRQTFFIPEQYYISNIAKELDSIF